MATEQQKPASEEAKTDLFEDDDEFEEFEINQGMCVLVCIEGFLCNVFYGFSLL